MVVKVTQAIGQDICMDAPDMMVTTGLATMNVQGSQVRFGGVPLQ